MGAIGEAAGAIAGGQFSGSGSGDDRRRADAGARWGAARGAGAANRGYRRAAGALDPYADIGADAGAAALDQARGGFSFGADDFEADPGYAFAREEGLRAVRNSAGTRGSPFGGQAMKEMAGYASGLASQQFAQREQSAFARWQAQIGNLQQLAGLGGNAAAAQASAATAAGGQAAGVYSAAGGQIAANNQTAIQTKGSFMDYF